MPEDKKKKSLVELTRCSASEYIDSRKLPLKIMADNVRSLYNIGAVFRTADAFMVEEIILAGISGYPPHPEISKTALGAEESVKWRHVDNASEEASALQKEGWKICCLEQAHGSIPLQKLQVRSEDRYLLVIGNEVEGVDQHIVDISDMIIEIPQCGVKHSLNVSSSASIAIWEFFRQLYLENPC